MTLKTIFLGWAYAQPVVILAGWGISLLPIAHELRLILSFFIGMVLVFLGITLVDELHWRRERKKDSEYLAAYMKRIYERR